MGIRLSTNIDVLAGLDNDLAQKLFGGNSLVTGLLDTLEHGTGATYQINASATEAIDFGDVTEARFIYLEAEGEFSVALAAAIATAGAIAGVAGSYPTGFSGGEVLELKVNTIAITVTFDVLDQTRDEVVARINFAAALADASFVADPIAFQNGAELDLRSNTVGPASTVEVLVGTSAAVLAALGLSVGTGTGAAAEAGTTDIEVLRPADPAGASAAEGVQAYFIGTVKATAIQVTNLSTTAALNLTTFIAGDLVATP